MPKYDIEHPVTVALADADFLFMKEGRFVVTMREFSIKAFHYSTERVREGLEVVTTKSVTQVDNRVPAEWLELYYPNVIEKYRLLSAFGMDWQEISPLAIAEVYTATNPAPLPNSLYD